jgi:hypothetical protein
MSDASNLPAVFDPDVVAEVANVEGVPRERLASLLADHQSGVRELPGVENLVYEWRRQFDATVLETTEAAYYVAAPPWVWDEFAESLDASAVEATAIASAHAEQVREYTGEDNDADDHALVVLARE